MSKHRYITGFGNEHATEAEKGALPEFGNSPQKPPLGLYAEQISGSAFTAPRDQNLRSWLYRIMPSVVRGKVKPHDLPNAMPQLYDGALPPEQMRWSAPSMDSGKGKDFLTGLQAYAQNEATGIYLYTCDQSMEGDFFVNYDAEMMIVPQDGALEISTEMGALSVPSGHIAVIPRGVTFNVAVNGMSRGYMCENYGHPFILPDLGPIGANGLANPRDFEYPSASYTDEEGAYTLIQKSGGAFWSCDLSYNPLNVVAWHGNYAPYRYDLSKFNTINTVSFDHPDPSIFTVLTSPSVTAGTADIDFVIFPPRWMVAENTFRPPYFHRNIMSECMGLIHGAYDGKEGGGFEPGGLSLHNQFVPHGPDAATVEKAMAADLKPEKVDGTLAFMFESRHVFTPTQHAMDSKTRQPDYTDVWQDMPKMFGK